MKHAYLLMAHNEINILKLLLKQLDHPNNTIYLHFDKKGTYNHAELEQVLKYSKIHTIKRRSVHWGGFDQIKCEYDLLKRAVKDKNDYYHLITGSDLLIKSNEEIDEFFEKNNGKEFIDLDWPSIETKNYYNRFDERHYRWYKDPKNKISEAIIWRVNKFLRWYSRLANKILKKKSEKYKNIRFVKGITFYDISHNLAEYVISKKRLIRKLFRWSRAGDELCVQTLAYNSPFKDSITGYCTRYIDWWTAPEKANPPVLTEKYYDDIIKSDKLYARKFSQKDSSELIEKLYNVDITNM